MRRFGGHPVQRDGCVVIEPCAVDVSRYPNIRHGWCPLASEHSTLIVDPAGNIRVCEHSPVVLGNIRHDSIRDMINRRYGIYFSDENRYLIESRLSERLIYLELESFDDYHHYLKYHPEGPREIEDAIDLLTTNETYFFREEYQLRAFSADILPH